MTKTSTRRLLVAIGAGGVLAAGLVAGAGAAHADPPMPTPNEREACIQAWTAPMDPRVNMRYGLGTIMYQAWVSNQCSNPDAKFPNGALVAGSGVGPVLAPWQQLQVPR